MSKDLLLIIVLFTIIFLLLYNEHLNVEKCESAKNKNKNIITDYLISSEDYELCKKIKSRNVCKNKKEIYLKKMKVMDRFLGI